MKRPFLLLLCVLVLAGCAYAPRGIEGVSSDDRWVALPLRGWLAEDRGRPEALIACLSADCPHKLMVALVTLQGDDARAAFAMLREPGRLAADLQARDARRERRRARARVELRSVRTGAVPGFAVVLAPEDGRRTPAHGAAFGRLEAGTLSLVLAIGDDAGATLAAAREAAAARLGP